MSQGVFSGDNHYLYYPDESLRGCGNDANNLLLLAKTKLSWPESGLTVLKDVKAEVEQAAVLAMLSGSQGGNHFIWSHSSHGTNNPDAGQKDGLEELLCCTDLQEQHGLWASGYISAKWIGQMVLKVHPQDTLDIILDCCYAPAGGQLKAIGRSYDRARFLPRSEAGIPVDPMAGKLVAGGLPKNVALWSGCQSDQTSADAYIDNSWQGAFTAAFLKAFKPGRTRVDIIAAARKWLKDNRYAQIPHLYCGAVMAQKAVGA